MIHKHHDRRNSYPPSPKRKARRGTGKRIIWLLLVGGFVAFAISRSSVSTERTATAAGPVKMSRLSARSAQETAELNGIDGGASAGVAFLAAKDKNNVYVVSTTKSSRTFDENATKLSLRDIRSATAHTNKEKALADAVAQANAQLAEALRALDPPIKYLPNEETLKTDYLAASRTQYLEASEDDKEAWKQAGLEPNRVWAKIDVEVSESQLRQLRGKDRIIASAKWLGGAFLVILLGYGFLRLDALTKGHLTFPLAIGALASIAATVGAFIYMLRIG
jgi:hypothetical protein